MKRVLLSVIAFASASVVMAGPEKSMEERAAAVNEMRPLLHHLSAPRQVMDLCGEWEQATIKNTRVTTTNSVGEAVTHWEEPVFNAQKSVWTQALVPALMRYNDGSVTHFFKRTFDLSETFAGKRIVLKMEQVQDAFTVWVNEEKFEGWPTFGLQAELDVTQVLKSGTNSILIRVANEEPNRNPREWLRGLASWNEWDCFGLCRPLYLEMSDFVYVSDVAVETKVEPEKAFHARVWLKNETDRSRRVVWSAEVKGFWTLPGKEVEIPAKSVVEVSFSKPWKDAKLWTPDTPDLYFLDLQVTENGKRLDAFRQRFGFREVKIKGNRITLNGYPFIARRGATAVLPLTNSDRDRKQQFEWLKRDGVNTMRLFYPGDIARIAALCDEAGMLICTCTSAGGGAPWRDDAFWPRYEQNLIDIARELRNHPSVIYWGVSNEFGGIYSGAEGRPAAEAGIKKQVKAAQVLEAFDPTRFWTAYGEVELGFPQKGTPGPAPVRSFHYPMDWAGDGHELPDIGYWYADGKLSWQRLSTTNKPLMISEDLYHGGTENHVSMTKFGNDSIYTPDGYAKTVSWAVRCFAAGHYSVGIGEWEPWCFTPGEPKPSPLYTANGQLMPDYLVAMRGFSPNLYSGETVRRTVFAYNQRFVPQDCQLVREDVLAGKVLSRIVENFRLDPGGKYEEQIEIAVPVVSMPADFELRYTLLGNDNIVLDRETFEFNIFPAKTGLTVGGKTVLLADSTSKLRVNEFPLGIFENTEEALKSGADRMVVDKLLSASDGKSLESFVRNGGRVMAIDLKPKSWSPLLLEFRRPQTFVWRRNDDRMRDIAEKTLRSWRPDGTLGDSGYVKSGADDSMVLFDSGHRNGLDTAQIEWIFHGEGAWLLFQLPVADRFDIEPVAPYVLQSGLDEFVKGSGGDLGCNATCAPVARLNGNVVVSPESPYADIFVRAKIEVAQTVSTQSVLVLDVSKGFTADIEHQIEMHCNRGGRVLLMEPPLNADPDYLAKLGVKLVDPVVPIVFKDGRIDSRRKRYPIWINRQHCSGIMQGLSTDDFFRGDNGQMWAHMLYWKVAGLEHQAPWYMPERVMLTAEIEALPDSKAIIMTTPGGIAEIPYLNGKIVMSTVRFIGLNNEYPRKTPYVLRTLLNNLGAKTASPEPVYDYRFIDIAKVMNRNLWNDTRYQKPDGSFDPKGWFGSENDMRYFPVNLCGWSMAARNLCPKEAFPTEPLNLGGKLFKLQDPETNKGFGCIVLEPGQSVRIPLGGITFRRLMFLGADNWQGTTLEMSLPGVKEPQVFTHDDHFNTYRWSGSVKSGKVAWVGETIKDPMATLYWWPASNTGDVGKPVPYVDLKNVSKQVTLQLPLAEGEQPASIALVAVIAECD